jgi:hypothetical protein
MLLYALDLPFSLMGDVVTWPYTAAYSFINQPVFVPPVTQALAEGPPQTGFTPDNKEPEKKAPGKDADQDKQSNGMPHRLPMPLPEPLTPPALEPQGP